MNWITRLFSKKTEKRSYAGGRNTRLTFNFKSAQTSADTELMQSLGTLRARSRALCRDVVYAKRARTVVVNNVIGSGVGMQANVKTTRNELRKTLNDSIEGAWLEWCKADACHTGGTLHFSDLERAAMSEVFVAGEAFIRKHARSFGMSDIPFALELIEAERLADEYDVPQPLAPGNMVRMGVEVDRYGRPVAYWVKEIHPNERSMKLDQRSQQIERVPADQIFHLKITDRWPQTRGEPWLHAAITRLNQLGEFEEAAVVAARIGASKVGFFESPDGDPSMMADGLDASGAPSMSVEAGEFSQLPPGYKFTSWDPNYPNEVFDPFTRAILRGIAAGTGVSYESLSRDYSQSNYSSSRLALIDDRDLWKTLQQWWIRSFRQPLHAVWLQAAILSGAVRVSLDEYATNRTRFESVRFKPRGWSWVDPTKEVNAYKEAVKAGFTTVSDVIASTGGGMDIEDVLEQRREELNMMESADLVFDTSPESYAVPEPAEPEPEPDPEPDEEEIPARVYALRGKPND